MLFAGGAAVYGLNHGNQVASLPSQAQYEVNVLSSSQARIVMIGDSITQSGHWSELLGERVANLGLGGSTTRAVLARLGSVPESAEIVFVMVGVDDFDVAGRPVADVASDTRRIVEALAPRKVVIESVLLTSFPNLNGGITQLNSLNRAYCVATDACRYLELNDLFSRGGLLRPEMTHDGIHLVGSAFPLWAARVKAEAKVKADL